MAPQKRRKALRRLLAAHDKSYPLMVLYPENCSEIVPKELKLIPDENLTITRATYSYDIGTSNDTAKATTFYGPASLSEPHAQIYRNKLSDSVWIKDLKSKQGTFLNGKKISTEFKKKVNPGDIITFGPSNNYKKAFSLELIKIKSKVNKVKRKKKDSGRMGNVLIDSPQNMVFNIPLLINKIFSFVRAPQKYRTINKATSVEISRQLGRSLKLKVEESPFDEQRFAKQLELFRKYKITTADFVLSDEAKNGYRDVLWFGDNHGDKIQNASVFIRAHNVGTIQASLRLLNCLVNCQELVLSVHICYNFRNIFKLELPLGSVKKLVFSEFRICCNVMNNTIEPTVVVELFNGFPNLEELDIPFRMKGDLLQSVDFLIPAPGESILLPKLVSLSIRSPMSSEHLEILAQIPHKLQKLVLDKCNDFEALNMVLAKHAGSLTTLKVGINGYGGGVVIPSMAKLRNLTIQCSEKFGSELVIKVGTLPELLVLKANVTSYRRDNPFELLNPFISSSNAEVKAKKLKLTMVWTESLIKDNVDWFREKFCANFPKGEFIQSKTPISFD